MSAPPGWFPEVTCVRKSIATCAARRVLAVGIVVLLSLPCWFVATAGAQSRWNPSRSSPLLSSGRRTTELPVTGGAPSFQAQVTIDPLPQAGYLGCRVELDAPSGFPADGRFVLRLTPLPAGTLPVSHGIVGELPIAVAQGDRRLTVQRRIPAETIGDGYRVELLEDGRLLDGYADEIGSPIPRRFRLVDYLIDRDSEVRLLPIFDPESEEKLAAGETLGSGTPVPLGSLQLADWRGYQAYDVVMISPASITKLREVSPEEFEAIRDWLFLGGILVIPGADDHAASLELIEAGVMVESFEGGEPVWGAPVGSGRVIGLPGRGPGGRVARRDWAAADRLVESDERRSLTLRRGVEPVLGDTRFGRWLIPGVAEPPVYTFIGLLTAFVVLVGPVAYRQTIRVGRGYLMFLIAPLLAVATTATMLTYGIVSDGFGTLARVRQLTWIDGFSGDAAERVRATYFAGLRPSDGLKFPQHAEVLTLREPDQRRWRSGGGERPEIHGTVAIAESPQWFSPSFLAARQQRQFVFHQPRRDVGVVRLSHDPDGDAWVSSTLGFPLENLIARDRDGVYWTVPSVAQGATEVRCQELDAPAAANVLGRLYARSRLVDVTGQSRSRSQSRSNSSGPAGWAQLLPSRMGLAPEAADGVFEHWLTGHLQIDGMLPESTFVAVAEVSPDVVAVESAELVESIRFVFGTMP